MKRFVAIALFLLANCFAAHVAVLETTRDDVNLLDHKECQFLTDKLRQMAIMELPSTSGYTIMTRENINTMLPPGKSVEECEGSCLVETGKNISADYVAQGRVSHFGSMVTLTVELYETASGKLMSSFAVQSENAVGLLKEIEERSAPLFSAIKEAEKPRQEEPKDRVEDDAQVVVVAENESGAEVSPENPVESQAKAYRVLHAFSLVVPIENSIWDDRLVGFGAGLGLNWSRYQIESSGFSTVASLALSFFYAEAHYSDGYEGIDANLKYGWGFAPIRDKGLLAFYGLLGFDFKYLDGANADGGEDYLGDFLSFNLLQLGTKIIIGTTPINDRVRLICGVDVMVEILTIGSYASGESIIVQFEDITFAPYLGAAIDF